MYDIARFRNTAVAGWKEIFRAVTAIGRNPYSANLLRRTWGPAPGLVLALAAVSCALAGAHAEVQIGELPFADSVYWPVALFAVVAAWRIRAVLFSGDLAEQVNQENFIDLFRSFAVPLLPAAAVLLLASPFARLAAGLPAFDLDVPELPPAAATFAVVMDQLRGAVALGAALAVTVATLTYRRDWTQAFLDLGIRFFVFRLLLGITLMVLGVMTPILVMVVTNILQTFIALLPEWLGILANTLTEDALVVMVHLALVGGSWRVAQESLVKLLEEGDVDLLEALSNELEGDDDEEAEPVVAATGP